MNKVVKGRDGITIAEIPDPDTHTNFTYVVSCRLTVDTQYIIRSDKPMPDEAFENLNLHSLEMIGMAQEAKLARNVRECEIADVTFTGAQLNRQGEERFNG